MMSQTDSDTLYRETVTNVDSACETKENELIPSKIEATKQKSNKVDIITNAIDKLQNLSNGVIDSRNNDGEDEFLTFGKYVGSQLKMFSHQTAIEAKLEIEKFLAQLCIMERNETDATLNLQKPRLIVHKKVDDVMSLDLQDKYGHISILNKSPVSFIQECAFKNHLVPHYDLIDNGILEAIISFKYSLTLGGHQVIGEGASKKDAKCTAAFNLFNQMLNEKSPLLNTYFKQCDFEKQVVSHFDNTIKVNVVGKLYEFCSNNQLELPEFNLIREEGQAHAKLFTVSCQVEKMIETASHRTKKQTKNLAAFKMIKKLMSFDKPLPLALENEARTQNSIEVLKNVEKIKNDHFEINPPINDLANDHTLLEKIECPNSDTKNDNIKQYNKDSNLDIANPY